AARAATEGRDEMSKKMEKSKSEPVVMQADQGEENLLSKILEEGRLGRDEVQAERAKDMISEFVPQVMGGQLVMAKDMDSAINARIAEIDKLISPQRNDIMHA